ACFLEVAGGILDETVELRFAADGTVALHTGAQPMGQGHLSTFPAVIAARLGIDPAAVRLVQGDSDLVPAGTPSVASRSMMMAGSAAAVACDAAVEKGRRIAAHHFEAAAPDVEFAGGRFRVRGTDRSVDLLQLAARARALPGLPDDLAGGLDSTGKFVSPQMTFPNGCHVTEVEIDPETGRVTVAGALPSAVNAILDALGTRGVGALDLPMSPSRVWAALREAAPSGDIGRPP